MTYSTYDPKQVVVGQGVRGRFFESDLRPRRFVGEDLAQDVGEDTAVEVVFDFDGGVEATEDGGFLF